MKVKTLKLLTAGVVLGMGVVAVAGVAANGGVVNNLFQSQADASRSFFFTASDFTLATGDFDKGGVSWHYEGASVSGNIVTMKKIYNTTAAGSNVNGEFRRGAGFNTVSFDDYSESEDFSGGAIYTFGFGRSDIVGRPLSTSVDLSTAQANSNLRRIFEVTEGAGTFSFSKMTVTYGCEEVQPEVNFSSDSYAIIKDEVETVTATASYLREAATYSFSIADDTVASIAQVGSSSSVEVTGLKAGTTTLTVTMTSNMVEYTDTATITVTAPKKNIISLEDRASFTSEGQDGIQNGQFRFYYENGATASIDDEVMTVNHVDGANWWATQIFFRDAYYNNNNEYKISFNLNASHAGSVQLNAQKYDIVVGDNIITKVGKPTSGRSTFEFVFGTPDSHLTSGTYVISNLVINDMTNDRYDITFNNQGNNTVIEGCAGKKLWTVPEDPVKADWTFDGWYDGETKVDLATFVPTEDVTLEARFTQEPVVTAVASSTNIMQDATLTVTATAVNFSGAVTYSATISDPTVLSETHVDNVFTVTGLKGGSATITINATDGVNNASAEAITINVTSSEYVIPDGATKISTKAEFLAFFNNSATNYNKSAYLANDINMDGAEINNIGVHGEYIGTFEGCGHTVSNFTSTRPLFNIIGSAGIVRNVSITCNWGNGSGFGVVSYSNSGTMINVDVEVTLTTSINTWAPLAIGGDGTYSYCDIIIHGENGASSNTLGGLVRGGGTFTNCTCQYKGIALSQFADKDADGIVFTQLQ